MNHKRIRALAIELLELSAGYNESGAVATTRKRGVGRGKGTRARSSTQQNVSAGGAAIGSSGTAQTTRRRGRPASQTPTSQ
jgi:hypothetical protein